MNFEPVRDAQVVAACSSEAVLAANLAKSPLLKDLALHCEWNAASAAAAYNRGLDKTTADILIFAHQDVWFPHGWETLLSRRIAEISALDPNWALIGCFGVGLGGIHYGPVWSSSLGQIVGRISKDPVPVQSFDEMVIILRRSSGLRFDEEMGGWHLYGTDIVTQARTRGMGAYVASLPCLHNDRFHASLGPDYAKCYRAMQKKWPAQLPLRSPITKISRSGLHLRRDQWLARRSLAYRREMTVEVDEAIEAIAERCGWLDLGPPGGEAREASTK